jgi:hypothetical protein
MSTPATREMGARPVEAAATSYFFMNTGRELRDLMMLRDGRS